ncbi:MAG: Fis family transcriptional regulator [Rhodospirillaceae bacterium]|nr:MAG: Fis family transcriptional regulator [Rhodospirillaceae bacterium]
MAETNLADDEVDAGVDVEIDGCLDLDQPRSFFLFAGAGSGKTRSLTIALNKVLERSRERLRLHRQKIAVITYTNAACDEIENRVQYDPLVEVSTIHSFVWSQINGFHADIRAWLEQYLQAKIDDLEEKQSKVKKITPTSIGREREIQSKSERLAELPNIKEFTYNPNGDNVGRDSLNHAEVIALGAEFLTQKPLMQRVLVNAFPIMLVDESQDTHGPFMKALLAVQVAQQERFSLGLLGDTMQRIYGHGMDDLDQSFSADWATPSKAMNHRSPERIVQLINRIRHPVDGRTQQARSDMEGGIVRLFITQSEAVNPDEIEVAVKNRMAEITEDDEWASAEGEVKSLILEHHMAARRLGFSELFGPLYKDKKTQTGLLDGTLPGLRLFSERVFPVVESRRRGDEFGVAAILRKNSELLSKQAFVAAGVDQIDMLKKASDAVNALIALWDDGNEPTFQDVLYVVAETGLFPIPDALRPFAIREDDGVQQELIALMGDVALAGEHDDGEEPVWEAFLSAPFFQIKTYRAYIDGVAAFDTHQGVKGREFDRVMVIIDDAEARGFLFSFDKLFGVKDWTATDLKNEEEGRDTGIDRTRRLLYVTCSRAMKSLALVLYSPNPEGAKTHSIGEEWFTEGEIEIL